MFSFQCFACGAEMGKHKRGHDYQLMVGHVTQNIILVSYGIYFVFSCCRNSLHHKFRKEIEKGEISCC